jgi:hypothetical protein
MNSISVEYTSLKSEDFNGHSKNNSSGGTNDGLKLTQPFNINFGIITLGGIVLCIIVIVVVVLFITEVFDIKEGMSGGTLTQMFAQDNQNANLNSMSPGVGSGNFDLFFNQPTRVASGTQRGTPLNKIALPETNMNPMKNQNNQARPDEQTIPCSMENPEACGNGKGNINYLKDGFVQPSDEPTSYVGLNGKIVYPTGYLGSLWVSPQTPGYGDRDVMKSLPIMKKNVSMTSKPYLPYVKEGYKSYE